MAANGVLVFDPAKDGTSNATQPPSGGLGVAGGAGGGHITGAGNYYSYPSTLSHLYKDVSEIVSLTGTLAGTLSIEVSNDNEDIDRAGNAVWVPFSAVIPAITSGMASFGFSNYIRYSRYRLKFVYSSGSGTIQSKRTIKGRA